MDNATPAPRAGDWMETYTGQRFWPLDPRAEEINILDIAHALSMQCRYNGHCHRFYSVAEHSLILSHYVPAEDAMWALLHDASEAYLSDVPRPLKRFLVGYEAMEAAVMAEVCKAFSLPSEMPASVKGADNRILLDEKAQLLNSGLVWELPEQPIGWHISGYSPYNARCLFLNRFNDLRRTQAEAAYV